MNKNKEDNKNKKKRKLRGGKKDSTEGGKRTGMWENNGELEMHENCCI